MTTTTLLPTSRCDNDQDHAAHTVYTAAPCTRTGMGAVRYMPVAQCHGRRASVTIAQPADPFDAVDAAYSDRDL